MVNVAEDDLRIMLDFMNMVNAFGTDPILSDILTEDNTRQICYLKDCIQYLGDIDFDLSDDDSLYEEDYEYILAMLQRSEKWSKDFMRGLALGILAGIETDSNNPIGFKQEMATLYRMMNAILLERTIE